MRKQVNPSRGKGKQGGKAGGVGVGGILGSYGERQIVELFLETLTEAHKVGLVMG